MAANESINDETILSLIEQEEGAAYGINDSALSDSRAQAIEYYLGDPFGNEVEGRSQVVSYDVQDTIESALPQLLKIFVSGDQVVRFDPKGPEDQEAAEQETDYINHVVMEKNPGFEIFYVWFKDALLSKNGYVKVWYEEYEESEEETYQGLTEGQLMLLTQDSNVEIVEQASYPDPDAVEAMNAHLQQMVAQGQDPATMQHPPIPSLYDVKIRVTEKRGCVKIANVAPENMMVSVDTPSVSLQDARFVQHRETMSRDDAEKMGFEVPENTGFAEDDSFYEEANARDIYNEQYSEAAFVNSANEILVKDTYMMHDGKRMRYVVIGNQIVHKEECDHVPFACITPHLMPHRHIGRSYADLTMDIQLIKSTLIRGQLDNMYLSNNGRYAVSDNVNIEDMLTSRPGGVVRTGTRPPAGEIMPLQHTPFPPTSFTLVEYFDSMKEKRTGVTAYNQGLDANSLNKTATGVNQIMQASQQRLELVARLFAETGVKELFILVHMLVRRNYTKPDVFRLRNKWVDVDPRQWKTRTDLTVSVGIGTGNKDQQLAHLMTILQAQKEAIQIGLATPKNIYNALTKLTQNAGFKNPEEFWTNPDNIQQQEPKEPQPSPDAVLLAQTELQKEQMRVEGNIREKQIDAQTKIVIEREKLGVQANQSIVTADQEQQKINIDLIKSVVSEVMRQMNTQGVQVGTFDGS